MPRHIVLVIEDDAAIRQGVIDALEAHGYATVQASDAVHALDLAVSMDCDLVLLDLVLPRGDGLDVLRGVREARPTLPVIILSARGREADRVAGLRLGADDYGGEAVQRERANRSRRGGAAPISGTPVRCDSC